MNELSEEMELDTWYKEMSEKPQPKQENESVVGLMEWVDIMVEYRDRE